MKPVVKRSVVGSLLGLFFLWLCFVGYIDWAMHQPPEVFARVMSHMPGPAYMLFPFESMWTSARKGTLQVGNTAPALLVQELDTQQSRSLSDLWSSRPVVLIFGSYT